MLSAEGGEVGPKEQSLMERMHIVVIVVSEE